MNAFLNHAEDVYYREGGTKTYVMDVNCQTFVVCIDVVHSGIDEVVHIGWSPSNTVFLNVGAEQRFLVRFR